MLEFFDIHPETADAMQRMVPMVVLESTIWIHGLPEEEALHAYKECCKIIRSEGAVPVTTAISNGRIKAGLTLSQLKDLIHKDQAMKVNIRDISYCLQQKMDGSTTVSTTIFIAEKLGAPVVVTGGMGGVHKNAGSTFDISADLHALASIPVALVASGVKSILDLGATLEVMETLGIPVAGYRTDVFPSFYCKSSPYKIPVRIDKVNQIAETYMIHRKLGMKQGFFIANPIPENASISENLINEMVEKSLMEANDLSITGKEITPFLLERLHKFTGGGTIHANTALIKSNCSLGAKLAKHILF